MKRSILNLLRTDPIIPGAASEPVRILLCVIAVVPREHETLVDIVLGSIVSDTLIREVCYRLRASLALDAEQEEALRRMSETVDDSHALAARRSVPEVASFLRSVRFTPQQAVRLPLLVATILADRLHLASTWDRLRDACPFTCARMYHAWLINVRLR